MQDTAERRIKIIKYLCKCRETTVAQLAVMFGVSERTIRRDLLLLSLEHPVDVRQGKNGGVFIMEGYRVDKHYLKDSQEELIRKYVEIVPAEEKAVLLAILSDFAKPKVS